MIILSIFNCNKLTNFCKNKNLRDMILDFGSEPDCCMVILLAQLTEHAKIAKYEK